MRLIYTETFSSSLLKFPESIQKKFHKQAKFLIGNLRHPSLRAKKYDESIGMWQARVDRDIRFYFTIKSGSYILYSITKHPK